jgi:hypothetical protein
MSRFDDELIKQAENAYQQTVGEGHTTTPRQRPYDQVNTVGTDSAPGVTQAPAPVDEMADWVANTPAVRRVDVRDLESADPAKPGAQGEIIGGPGSSAVYPEGQQMYATKNPIDESLYNVYKASREIRDAIDSQVDFDFSRLMTASTDAATVLRFASTNDDAIQIVGTIASIVDDIESDLIAYGDYRQASADLTQLESLLEDINKYAGSQTTEEEKDESSADDEDSDDNRTAAKKSKSKSKKDSCKHCKGKGCEKCEDEDEDEDDDKPAFLKKKKSARTEWCKGPGCKIEDCDGKTSKEATNGNQETLQVVDVRDLDDQAGLWDRQRVTTPDHVTNVLVPEEVNGEDAAYVNFYNDGAETGITPGDGPHKQQLDFNDGTNPALVPYQQVAGAVQASREKIFAAIQVVDRLEKLGMVQHDDRAKHIAKFEQMSDSKLAGFVASIDMLEDSGARQPRSQKVASGSNRLPEMGRLTTASTVTRQDIASDDWLMTL